MSVPLIAAYGRSTAPSRAQNVHGASMGARRCVLEGITSLKIGIIIKVDKGNFPPARHKLGYDWETDENWFQ